MHATPSATTVKRSRQALAELAFMAIILGFFLAAPLAFSSPQQALPDQGGFIGQTSPVPGGFTGPGLAISSVNEVRSMRDDAQVVLQGYITRSLGGENYLFQDDSGTISVEIDHEVWQGQSIGPKDLVVIHGEVDRDFFSCEVEVDRIIKR